MSKEASVVIIDVALQMFKTTNGNSSSPIDMLVPHLKTLIVHKIISNRSSDSLGMVHVNSSNTNNSLAEKENGEYGGIEVVKELDKANYKHIKYLMPIKEPRTSYCADYIDAIIVAADMIIKLTEKKKYKEKNIILATDLSNPAAINKIGLEDVISRLCECGINIELMLVQTNYTNKLNLEIMKKLIHSVAGITRTITVDTPLGTKSKRVRQMACFKGYLDFANDAFQIPVQVFVKTMSAKLLTASRLYWDESFKNTFKLERSLAYAPSTYNRASFNGAKNYSYNCKRNMIRDPKILKRAYKYGKTLVPFSAIDEQQLIFHNLKSFSIIGFIKEEHLSRHYFMSNTYIVTSSTSLIEDTDVHDYPYEADDIALQALIAACRQKSSLVLARQVFRNGATLRLAVLMPFQENGIDCFLMTHLPFAEDVCQYDFNSFDKSVTALKGSIQEEQQMNSMRNWVDSMTLKDDAAYDSKEINNPKFKRQLQCILNRLGKESNHDHPKDSLLNDQCIKEKEDIVTPIALINNSRESLRLVKESFGLEAIESFVNKDNLEMVRFWSLADEADSSLLTLTLQQETIFEEYKVNDNSKPTTVMQIRRDHLLEDFEAMSSNPYHDLVTLAMLQLMSLISRLASLEISLAFLAIKALRKVAIQEDEYEKFNEFLRDMKRLKYIAPSRFPLDLWNLIKDSQISLISLNENSDCKVGIEEAMDFMD